MNYHAPTHQFTISPDELARASAKLLYAIRNIRDGAGLSRKGWDYQSRKSEWAEYAEGAILNAARDLGIDLGSTDPGKLDVSDA